MLTCPQCGASAYRATEYVEDRWTRKLKRNIAWQCAMREHHNGRRERRTTPTKDGER